MKWVPDDDLSRHPLLKNSLSGVKMKEKLTRYTYERQLCASILSNAFVAEATFKA